MGKVVLTVSTNKRLRDAPPNDVEVLALDDETGVVVLNVKISAHDWWHLCTGQVLVIENEQPEPDPTLVDLISEIDTDLAMLARHEHAATGDTKVADRATRRLVQVAKALRLTKEGS